MLPGLRLLRSLLRLSRSHGGAHLRVQCEDLLQCDHVCTYGFEIHDDDGDDDDDDDDDVFLVD